MPILGLLIIGALVGFAAHRMMHLQTSMVKAICLGMVGAVLGGLLLRLVLAVLGVLAGVFGAFLGALAVIWLWQRYQMR